MEGRFSGHGRDQLRQSRPYTRLRPGPGQKVDEVASDQRRRLLQAMLDLATEEGYESITVRRLSELAGVSTASFYARFDGKEDCFLSTCSVVLDRIHERVRAARAHAAPRRAQLTRTVEAFLAEPTADPEAAKVALVDAFVGGPAAVGRMRAFEKSLEIEIGNSLSRRGVSPSLAVVGWITAGCFRACRHLLTSDGEDSKDLAGRLAAWGATCLDSAAENPSPQTNKGSGLLPDLSDSGDRLRLDERDMILAAITKLATHQGYWGIRVNDIRKQAGLSRAAFDVHFSGVEECYLTAAVGLARSYLSEILVEFRTETGTTRDRFRRASAALMMRLAAEPAKARFAFVGILDPGVEGLKHRERLIGELAADWQDAGCLAGARGRLEAEASVGAFWNAIAGGLDGNASSSLVTEAATFASLLMASGARSLPDGPQELERKAHFGRLALSTDSLGVTSGQPLSTTVHGWP